MTVITTNSADPTQDAVTGSIPAGAFTEGIAVGSDGTLYVANNGGGTVSVIPPG